MLQITPCKITVPLAVVKLCPTQLHTWMLTGILLNKIPDPSQQRFINSDPCTEWSVTRIERAIKTYEAHMGVVNFVEGELSYMRRLIHRHVTTKPKPRTRDEERQAWK